MNKKMVVGILLTVVGLIYSALCFMYAAMNPCIYNGMDGLLGGLLGAGIVIPFVVSTAVMCLGILICLFEAYRKEK